MSSTAKRVRSLIVTVLAIAATNIAVSFAGNQKSGVATTIDGPRPKSGVATTIDAPRPKSGVATTIDAPRPKSGVATTIDAPRP